MGEFINPADVPKVKFYTGDEAPCIGMGTFGSDRFTADQIAEAVDGAIKSGYRMFDCARHATEMNRRSVKYLKMHLMRES